MMLPSLPRREGLNGMSAAPSNVVVLDLDDTLYPERDFVISGFSAVAHWLHRQMNVTDFGRTAQTLFANGRRGDIFDAALAELGLTPTPELIAQLVDIYRDHQPSLTLPSDTVRFLAHIPENVGLALLTDGFVNTQQNKIRALGLDRAAIWPMVCTGQWGRDYWKPHRRGYEFIQASHRLPPSAFCYVADNPAKDFIAPRTLGWRTVCIRRPDAIHPARSDNDPLPTDLSISSLDELTGGQIARIFQTDAPFPCPATEGS